MLRNLFNIVKVMLFQNPVDMVAVAVLIVSYGYMDFFNVIPRFNIAEPPGDYFSLLIFSGFCLKVYISGISDMELADSDKIVYSAAGTIIITLGFIGSIFTVAQFLISMPLILIVGYRAYANISGNFLTSGQEHRWVASNAWRREIKTLIFVSIVAVLLQIMVAKNGGRLPANLMF